MRLTHLSPDQLTAQQQDVMQEAAAGRGGQVPLPLTAWVRSPDLARHAQRLGAVVRFGLTIPPRQIALAALLVGVHWDAPYLLRAQSAKARAEGVPDAAVAAILNGETPAAFADPLDAACAAVVRALLSHRSLDSATYAMGEHHLGERGLVELVAAVGYYTTVAMTLTAFEIDTAP